MQTALSQFANCTLIFSKITGYDQNSLNEEPITSEVEVTAMLKARDQSSQISWLTSSGQDFEKNQLSGYAFGVIPSYLDNARGKFDSGETGKVVLKTKIPSPFYNQPQILGYPIQVYFYPDAQ
jgi:hypothetical protein